MKGITFPTIASISFLVSKNHRTSDELGCGVVSIPALLSASVWSCTSEHQSLEEDGRVKLFQETCNLIEYSDLLFAVLQNAAT